MNCCVTSPPYFGLRDYGMGGQIGLEKSPDEFVAKLVEVFREVRRVLRDDGTLWLNLGDSYNSGPRGGLGGSTLGGGRANQGQSNRSAEKKQAGLIDGLKTKDLIGIPWRVAFALQADGWYLRQDIIWHKPNPVPESVRDRCTKAHEYIFLLSKSPKYYFDHKAMQEPAKYAGSVIKLGSKSLSKGQATGNAVKPSGNGNASSVVVAEFRNRRDVWIVATRPFKEAHFATFPPALIEPCVLAGCPVGGTVLDPFGGAGTTGLVAARHGREYVLCELNPEYAAMAEARILKEQK